MHPTFHQILRTSTAPLHDLLDSAIVVDAISGSEIALATYLGDFYKGLIKCWADLDWEALRNIGLSDIELRKSRYESLVDDLCAWGTFVPPLPDASSGSVGRSIGIAYVLEGSMHGGRSILAKARSNLDAISPGQTRFLEGFGKDTPRVWSEFLQWLGTIPIEPALTTDACDAAKECFEAFIQTIRRINAQPFASIK